MKDDLELYLSTVLSSFWEAELLRHEIDLGQIRLTHLMERLYFADVDIRTTIVVQRLSRSLQNWMKIVIP